MDIAIASVVFIIYLFVLRLRGNTPRSYFFANDVKYGLHYVTEKTFYSASSVVERFLPHLNCSLEIESNDQAVYHYNRLVAKPDLVARSGNKVYIGEFKSKKYADCSGDMFERHMLQVLVCAYAYYKNNKDSDVCCVLRFIDAVLVLENPEQHFPYIEFMLDVSPNNLDGYTSSDNKITSTNLAIGIQLTAEVFSFKPVVQQEKEVRGELMHSILAYDRSIPPFTPPEPINHSIGNPSDNPWA